MKKYLIVFAALAAVVSCKSLKNEWDPVFDGGNNLPGYFVPVSRDAILEKAGIKEFTTIADLKKMYNGTPVIVTGNVWIEGQVTTSDQSGNIYNEIYIQDKTGAIDLKLGRSSLYSEYKIGQRVYVFCDGFTLGSYSGHPQLGFKADDTSTNEYETSYIQLQSLIDQHVFRGFLETPITPKKVTDAQLAASIQAGYQGELWGQLVTIEKATYDKEIFALFYPNPNLLHKSGNPENRVFLSGNGTWGVTTWACTKAGYVKYLNSGVWDMAEVGSGSTKYGRITVTPAQTGMPEEVLNNFGMDMFLTFKEIMIKYASANYISHYFTFGSQRVAVRTSGYSKFADTPLDERIQAGTATATFTGILTYYSSGDVKAQISLIDDPSISVVIE